MKKKKFKIVNYNLKNIVKFGKSAILLLHLLLSIRLFRFPSSRTKTNLSRPGWLKEEYEVENQSGPAMRRYESLKFALEIRDSRGSSRSLKQARGDMKIDLRKLEAACRSKQLKRKSQVGDSSLKNLEKKSASRSLKQARGDMKIDLRKLEAACRSKQLKRKSQVGDSSLENLEKKSASRSLKQARGDMKIDLRKLEAACRSKQLKRKSQVGDSSLKNLEKKSATESGHALFITEKTLTLPQPVVTSNPSATAVPGAATTPALTEVRSQSMVDAFLSLERRFLSEPPIVDPKPLVTESSMLQRRRAELAYDEYIFYQNLAAREDERTREIKNAVAARDEAIESKLKAEASKKEAEDNFMAATKALEGVNGLLVESQLKVEELKRQVAIEREGRNEDVRSLDNKIKMLEGDLVSTRAGIDLDWPSILKGKEFAPIRDTIFQVAVDQVRETLQKAHPGIDLTCLNCEEGEATNVEHAAVDREIETSARKENVLATKEVVTEKS